MADLYIDWCPKCGGRGEIARENGEMQIRCNKCGRSVTICNEDKLTADHKGRMNVVPYAKGRAAIDKWNEKEEVNGR